MWIQMYEYILTYTTSQNIYTMKYYNNYDLFSGEVTRKAPVHKPEILTVFHRSNDLSHMKQANFSLDYADGGNSIFGAAFYFSSSNAISKQLGKHMGEFTIELAQPSLNMNDQLTVTQAQNLWHSFLQKTGLKVSYSERGDEYDEYDFDDYGAVDFGNFFLELQDKVPNSNAHFKDFIQGLGFKSFFHYQDFGTNFVEEEDCGYCYGIYDPSCIKYIGSVWAGEEG